MRMLFKVVLALALLPAVTACSGKAGSDSNTGDDGSTLPR